MSDLSELYENFNKIIRSNNLNEDLFNDINIKDFAKVWFFIYRPP